jgi:hypothetical protein
VETPGGAVISYQQRSAGGGVLDRDDVDGGPNSIENIIFDDPNPGTYRVWVQLYEGGGGTWSLAVYDGVSPVLNSASRRRARWCTTTCATRGERTTGRR